ncbi:MAG: hypothetical protein E7381_01120 [Clostridiales bacterium]|nr:hypothetical protein [Clostridiales bacterium]
MYITDKKNIVAIEVGDALYPKEWENLPDKPKTLYAIGNTKLLKEEKFAIVGSRTTIATALKLGAEIAKEITQAFAVVTGVADGGDSSAIEGAILGGGKIICLLAGGFSALPQSNLTLLEKAVQAGGLLLSPHAYEVGVRAFSYEYRNKLLAFLSEGVLVTGAGQKSGALITARYAYKLKKPVFAFPYPPNAHAGVGCNAVIKAGGYLTESAEDIFKRFGLSFEKREKRVNLTQDERKVLDILREKGEAHISELGDLSGIPVFKAKALLSALEVKGLVVSLGGNRYAPV